MEKIEMLQEMKQRNGEDTLIFFRNGDNYEAYYSDAEKVSELLGAELLIVDSVPTVSISESDTDKVLDAGYGISRSQMRDSKGNFVPRIAEDVEVLHLYDD